MSGSGEEFKTPSHSRHQSRISSSGATVGLPSNKLTIPASPAMKRLGFGTGVNVFLLERFSPNRGQYGSPWAIKKINSKLNKRVASQSPEDSSSCKKSKANDDGGCRRQTVAEMCNSRLEAEAKLLRSLKHPNIIGFRSYTTALDGSKCLVMESGERDLYSILEDLSDQEDDPLPSQYIHKVCIDTSSGLQYLHETHHLLHGDIKSANILVKGDFKQVKLCDFGVCLKLDEKLSALPSQFYVGTECWSPPEVILGDVPASDKSDIFAFGLTIWECVALCPPHVHLLSCEPGEDQLSEEEQNKRCEEREELLQSMLGTRPALPLVASCLGGLNLPLLESFHVCTNASPADRPSARQLVTLYTSMLEHDNTDSSTNREGHNSLLDKSIDDATDCAGKPAISFKENEDVFLADNVKENNQPMINASNLLTPEHTTRNGASVLKCDELDDPVKVGPQKLFSDDSPDKASPKGREALEEVTL